MAKRVADKYLTDQNWEEEDEPEDAGKFKQADDDVLKNRIFKKARRRGIPQTSGSGAFSGFTGLTSKPSNGFKGFDLSSPLPPKPFSFQSKELAKPDEKKKISEKLEINKIKDTCIISSSTSLLRKDGKHSPDQMKNSEYTRHLSALNRSVSRWIANHVEKNPLCDLSPIFIDYKKHLEDIDEKFEIQSQSDSSQSVFAVESESSPRSSTSPSSDIQETTLSEPLKTPPTPPKNPLGTFLTSSSTTSPFKGFTGFETKSTQGFSGFQFSTKMVGSSQSTSSDQTAAKGSGQVASSSTEDEYVPPKPQSGMVEEKDAFCTKKCKLFYLKEGSYTDRGVGYIYLKPIPSSKKTQVLVRTDTSLGNVLLNISLNPAMPISKHGKNNIAISCIPNPPINESKKNEVVSMLIRVKSSEDADELLQLLNEKKKEAK